MKIALLGYGKMGRMIEEIALHKGHTILAKFGASQKITEQPIQSADVCIDFSHPSCVIDHIKLVSSLGKNLVVGTTGWLEQLEQVKGIVKDSKIGFLYAPNFSLGVHLFLKVVAEAALLIDRFEDYDIAVIESHHNKKADTPSGTAKAISDLLLKNIKRKTTLVNDQLQGQIAPHELHVASIRYGSVPGTHSVMFDSPADTITLTHQARSREGFARGAVAAAEWLQGKHGFYTIEDLISGGIS
jgi:4-hydroxy-tetrahydrodipicolinate reductase